MKRYNKITLFILLILTSLFLVACGKKTEGSKTKITQTKTTITTQVKKPVEKHLLLDEMGNYGGNLNKSKYGEGAPLNGALDVEDTIYYVANDYYNLESTASRTIIPKFAPYQQTMKDSGGIACALMVFNYCDEDIMGEFSEEKLVKKYEELNNTTVYNNGVTPQGLTKLFKDKGYDAMANSYIDTGENNDAKMFNFMEWIRDTISEGKIILLPYQDGIEYRWHVVIGIDTMNTVQLGVCRDDVIILADPFDASDHYQDGYSITSLSRIWRWWRNMGLDGNVIKSSESVVITSKKPITIDRKTEDSLITNPFVPERHLLLNKDGSFGGTYNYDLYGGIAILDGYYRVSADYKLRNEHTEYSYHAYPDYYNLQGNETRTLLTNFKAFQQSMASACGICSTLAILDYYGYDFADVEYYINDNTFGAVEADDYGKKQEAVVKIYMQGDSYFSDPTKKFKNYGGVGSGNLSLVSKALGYNPTFGRYYRSSFVSAEQSMVFPTYNSFLEFVKEKLSKGMPIAAAWTPTGGHWEVIIGIDTMGTESIYDDVIVLADSHDVFDHYQDGYNTMPAELFYSQWFNSSGSTNQQYVVFPNGRVLD